VVKIRLRRCGRPKNPFYRIVVCDSTKKRDGAVVATLGHYNPKLEKNKITVNGEKYNYWLKCGAQPTEIVARLVKKSLSAA